MGALTVGLPRALLYHKYRPLWETFFAELGCETVTSPPTTRAILARGTELAVDESCLSVKVFLGHVDALRGACDCVFVPRIESLHARERVCVKFMGACDIVRNALPDVEVVGYDVDVSAGRDERGELVALGQRLCGSAERAERAYEHARRAQDAHERRERPVPFEAGDGDGRPRVLVVGHPYNLHDALIGKPVLDLLEACGAQVVLSETVEAALAREAASALTASLDWTYNKELIGAVALLRDAVDGVVFVVAFPCGPDSMMVELLQRRLAGLPVLVLVIDELTGTAGLATRVESFVDILSMHRHAR